MSIFGQGKVECSPFIGQYAVHWTNYLPGGPLDCGID